MNVDSVAPPQGARTGGTAFNLALWVAQAALALAFAAAGTAALLGVPKIVATFDAVGIGQWFRYVTGALEVTGAILVVIPRTKVVGAALFVPIMLGAITTHLLVLHNGPTAPVVLISIASFVLWGRRLELGELLTRMTGRGGAS